MVKVNLLLTHPRKIKETTRAPTSTPNPKHTNEETIVIIIMFTGLPVENVLLFSLHLGIGVLLPSDRQVELTSPCGE